MAAQPDDDLDGPAQPVGAVSTAVSYTDRHGVEHTDPEAIRRALAEEKRLQLVRNFQERLRKIQPYERRTECYVSATDVEQLRRDVRRFVAAWVSPTLSGGRGPDMERWRRRLLARLGEAECVAASAAAEGDAQLLHEMNVAVANTYY